ncbi:MAG: methylated-DNA--[protein]-cysteine S-methyltransferase [Gemmatimonadota bacterium]|nr:methylated-DNA--[protein]-cysteine S-methyltransferase [Gemmatimonadota bacterium]MDH3428136.1 methylated-DNA--[protein]-cysteine S-methyltransferase [Gemmatimonadota bacterium]
MRHEAVYEIVRQIPVGTVCTYGQVAELAGSPGAARQVGYALAALPDSTTVPWHRVLNARGMISQRPGGAVVTQRLRLEREGVAFGQDGRVDLEFCGWIPNRNGFTEQSV